MPTAREARSIAKIVSPTNSELEQAIVLAVLRGYQRPQQAAKFLNVDEQTIRKTSRQMDCFLVDADNGKIWLK
jgi:hypothetical protein